MPTIEKFISVKPELRRFRQCPTISLTDLQRGSDHMLNLPPLPSRTSAGISEFELLFTPSNMAPCPSSPLRKPYWAAAQPKPYVTTRPKGPCMAAKKKKPPQPPKRPEGPYMNVMYDPRVARGSNVARLRTLLADNDPFDKAAEKRKQKELRRKMQCVRQPNATPRPVDGRQHESAQTDTYLEELWDRPPQLSEFTQTDLYLEVPPIPPYVPAQVGVDASTEIGEDDLFHFDAEAEPIIEVLVDGAIEQSMLEVAHEIEIAKMHKKQDELLAQREAELAELRRLEAEEERLVAEKRRRSEQERVTKALDVEMQKRITTAKLLQGEIAGLLPQILEEIEPATDAAKKTALVESLSPWLTQEVAKEAGKIVKSREMLSSMIRAIIKERATIYAGYKEDAMLELPPDMDEEEHVPECMVCEGTEASVDCTPASSDDA